MKKIMIRIAVTIHSTSSYILAVILVRITLKFTPISAFRSFQTHPLVVNLNLLFK
jgi:hypothetical protein